MMTATCPPVLRSEVLSYIGITSASCHIIHAPTDRPEISYNVKLCKSLEDAEKSLVQVYKKWLDMKKEDHSRRVIAYARSKKVVNKLASKLGCKPFHADLSEEENKETFRNWVDGKTKVIVATSLLGCGIDVHGVDLVLHLGTPWSVLDFAQESGRAGRGGRPSTSFVFASENEWEVETEEGDKYGKRTMRDWALETLACRRMALSSFLDGGHTTCATLPGGALCDFCRKQSTQAHPGKLFRFSAPTIHQGDIPPPSKPPHIPPISTKYERDRKKHER